MRYYPRGKVIRHFPLSNPHICPTNPLLGGGGGGGGGWVGPNIDRCIIHGKYGGSTALTCVASFPMERNVEMSHNLPDL